MPEMFTENPTSMQQDDNGQPSTYDSQLARAEANDPIVDTLKDEPAADDDKKKEKRSTMTQENRFTRYYLYRDHCTHLEEMHSIASKGKGAAMKVWAKDLKRQLDSTRAKQRKMENLIGNDD